MIEAKKLAYADMLRYVGDTRFSQPPVGAMLDKALREAARERHRCRAARRATCSRRCFDGLTTSSGSDTIYLSVIDRDGNIVSLIQSIYEGFGSGDRAARHRLRAAQSRRAVHARRDRIRTRSLPASGRCTPSSPASWSAARRASASASWAASTRRRRTRSSSPTSSTTAWTFSRRSRRAVSRRGRSAAPTSNVEALVPESVRDELTALGHEVTVVPPRTGTFGHGQAVMSDGIGRALRRVRAATRRRGDPGSARICRFRNSEISELPFRSEIPNRTLKSVDAKRQGRRRDAATATRSRCRRPRSAASRQRAGGDEIARLQRFAAAAFQRLVRARRRRAPGSSARSSPRLPRPARCSSAAEP